VSDQPLDDASIIRTIADALPVGVWVARAPGGEFVYANGEFSEIMGMNAVADATVGGYTEPYGICGRDGKLYPEDKLPFVLAMRQRKVVMVDDLVIHRRDGRKVPVRAYARPMFDGRGEITHVVIAFFDITLEDEARRSRIESEARLHRAQRMEAIGKLAGGIAHDFNNLLTAIRAVATRLANDEPSPQRRSDLAVIDEVAERATQLTRALVGFAGRGKHLSEAQSIHDLLGALAVLFRRTLDARIELCLELDASDDEVAGDPSQLEQVLMNLILNARDAMPDGGRLTLRTGDGRDGKSVVIDVIDTGVGIAPGIADRIFEPYFTTKTDGAVRGSGLGLATAYGIVESHGGTIEVLPPPREGAPPPGTTLRVILPTAAPNLPRRTAGPPAPAAQSGAGSVLLVEDESLVRVATFRVLKQLGYSVVACGDGEEAIDIFRERHRELSAVILDMVMPKLSGRDTYLRLREIDATVPVLLTTGFAANEEV
jgi:signal transduction histidine kinase